MSQKPIIRAVDLRKTFELRVHLGSIKALLLSGGKIQRRTVEALQGVDLDIYPGEAVGLIGRNGSGKSTFLSLVGKIYLPTSGTLEVGGRVAPLLELGAGFHPDLTGRENIELNGVILGMTRRQMAERQDSIIAFAEIERFIDAPLRTYSSGMQMRLAFAVAAHADAEIFIVDEALAVGDEEFQEKCFAQIEKIKERGRTILFVSHELTDITRVASRAIWMDKGRVRMDTDPHTVVEAYLRETHHLDDAPQA
jgi:ABC-type polysaccharide/polyol phosphate transport system ATPase subunit